MSSNLMLIHYPDGTIRYGYYHNTSDIAAEWVCDTPDEARERWRNGPRAQDPAPDEVEHEVTFWDLGTYWEGRATTKRITYGADPYDQASEEGYRIVELHPIPRHSGTPDWVPAQYRRDR